MIRDENYNTGIFFYPKLIKCNRRYSISPKHNKSNSKKTTLQLVTPRWKLEKKFEVRFVYSKLYNST